jgi:hypothetical protein
MSVDTVILPQRNTREVSSLQRERCLSNIPHKNEEKYKVGPYDGGLTAYIVTWKKYE